MGSLNEFAGDAWKLHPVLSVPKLFPPAVLFSLFDSDPLEKYKEALERLSQRALDKQADPPPGVDPQIFQQSKLIVAWDTVFQEIPGNKVGLLYQNPEQSRGSGDADKQGGGQMVWVGIMSNAPAGPKWFVTRAAQLGGQPVCWCIRIDVEKGKTSEVVLTAENMTVLGAL
jgi:hypothetical protein